jgi:hypothetical protein
VLLASQFQGFCRDLHSECVAYLVKLIAPPASLGPLLVAELTRGRQLDRGNAQPSSLGADFNRFDVFWKQMEIHNSNCIRWKADLDLLNEWRNAIVHQDFTSVYRPGIIYLRLSKIRTWRKSCGRIGRAMDEVMRAQLHHVTGSRLGKEFFDEQNQKSPATLQGRRLGVLR